MPICSECPPEIKHCYVCSDCIKETNPKPFRIKGGRLEYFCSVKCRAEVELNK